MTSNLEAVDRDLEQLGEKAAQSGLAAVARTLARRLDDPRTSSTSVSMCSKSMIDVMRELRSLAPPLEQEDDIERARKRRADRLARQSATGATSPS